VGRDLLRFATAGSVDDGKSTLVGRLLYDTKSVLADQIEAVHRASVDKGLDCPRIEGAVSPPHEESSRIGRARRRRLRRRHARGDRRRRPDCARAELDDQHERRQRPARRPIHSSASHGQPNLRVSSRLAVRGARATRGTPSRAVGSPLLEPLIFG